MAESLPEAAPMRFATGAAVRVVRMMPPGHVRTPAYLRGKRGIVERRLGPFPSPEELAYHRSGGSHDLYRVRFTMAEIWGGHGERPQDTLEAEIYAHWLLPEIDDAT